MQVEADFRDAAGAVGLYAAAVACQGGGDDAGIVEDQQIAGIKQIGQITHAVIAPFPVAHHKAARRIAR
ncbi:MAG TPA: hypothetical protein DCO73_01505, partial [Alphaproteobacteria bacterium]|nr:hypothetical protein [Alphaproteobacteria bacterium]